MHLKLFLSLLVLGLSSATLFSGRRIFIRDDGMNIRIMCEDGHRINIAKNRFVGLDGMKNIDITLTGPLAMTRSVRIPDRRMEGLRDQSEILTTIFDQFQGTIDETTYVKLLKLVEHCVQREMLDRVVLDILMHLTPEIKTMFLANHELFLDHKNMFSAFNDETVFDRQFEIEDRALMRNMLDRENEIETLIEAQHASKLARMILDKETQMKKYSTMANTPETVATIEAMKDLKRRAEITKDLLDKKAELQNNIRVESILEKEAVFEPVVEAKVTRVMQSNYMPYFMKHKVDTMGMMENTMATLPMIQRPNVWNQIMFRYRNPMMMNMLYNSRMPMDSTMLHKMPETMEAEKMMMYNEMGHGMEMEIERQMEENMDVPYTMRMHDYMNKYNDLVYPRFYQMMNMNQVRPARFFW